MTTLPVFPDTGRAGVARRFRFVDTPRFEYLPVGFFGAVMGLTGLSAAWQLAAARYGMPVLIADALGWIALAAFVALTLAYGMKAVTSPQAVRAEFKHPIAGNLFGTPLISLLLLPIVLVRISPPLAAAFWVAGTVGMIAFAWFIVSRWLSNRQQVAHATPAWIVPVVGLLDVPLAVPVLGLPHVHGVMVFSLAVGLFFAVPLFTLIFARLLFEEPMPTPLRPSLLILVAPFAVGFSSYVATIGHVDGFAEALFFLSLFVLAVLVGRLRDLPVCCPFRVSWWAVSFPLAASAAAAFGYAAYADTPVADGIALVLLAFASLVIAGLAAWTVLATLRGELRALSG